MVSNDEATAVILARLEGKLDAAILQHAVMLSEHGRRLDDIEPRLRAQEQRSVVTPAAMWIALGVLAAIVAAVVPFLDRLYS
ncbi:hypothetical protein AB0H43_03055 [Hamadaea sp. NPDC050747]|uniref:hypothetical protein n=1 Tax=Hamadaea sp. NPDC050747 TaxID=3155789 RepID=UPI0033D9E006